ncbi:hypothetical protein Aab01nite_08060 [Paractinoplanes abujensis]|uniref:DICT domain-containing protein n=1 Tax=Paractinoplanes abujensis TaxID=882441 RepID=A0A7W7CQD3_9ACTN|nr:DICT sensory domain-containing protein [Actinoplanes abujensis]MBB4691370.1 hypothetical protein [Actinoplanes abujensis]GID17216.1 hypothetical protein Aab01nite_08060 [Actinoplanes abujensis]
MPDVAVDRLYTKRTLVVASHAIEQAALAAAEDGPLVVIALFQRMPYFDRERAVYERIAGLAAVTVVGVVADQPPELPARAHPVLLDDKEELAREWTVVVLTPRFGALLVAHDQEQIDGTAGTIESGRLFSGRVDHRRDAALHEVLRLRTQLADRLPAGAVSALDAVVARVRELPATPGEARTDALLRALLAQSARDNDRLNARRLQARTARPGAGDDPLTSPQETQRWSGGSGVTAPGVLAVALLAVRIGNPTGTAGTVGRTAARHDETVINLLVSRLRPADRASRVGQGEFLLYLPALTYDEAVAFAYRIGADFAEASQRNAFLSAAVHVALTVTRHRPLPVDKVREALQWAVTEGVPVATIDG